MRNAEGKTREICSDRVYTIECTCGDVLSSDAANMGAETKREFMKKAEENGWRWSRDIWCWQCLVCQTANYDLENLGFDPTELRGTKGGE